MFLVKRGACAGISIAYVLFWIRACTAEELRSLLAAGNESSTNNTNSSGWYCYPDYYDDGFACDCNCGAPDPDCDIPGAPLYGCYFGQVCSENGYCTGGNMTQPPTVFNNNSTNGNNTNGTNSSGWFCYPEYYDDGFACDCGCGIPDPDCDIPGAPVYGCSFGESCSAGGVCEYNGNYSTPYPTYFHGGDGNGTNVTNGTNGSWFCYSAYYDDGFTCDCNCGSPDPDCDIAGAPVYNCPHKNDICSDEGKCVSTSAPEPDNWKLYITFAVAAVAVILAAVLIICLVKRQTLRKQREASALSVDEAEKEAKEKGKLVPATTLVTAEEAKADI